MRRLIRDTTYSQLKTPASISPDTGVLFVQYEVLCLGFFEPFSIFSHPLILRLGGVLHNVCMSFAVVRPESRHPVFESIGLNFVVAQIAFENFLSQIVSLLSLFVSAASDGAHSEKSKAHEAENSWLRDTVSHSERRDIVLVRSITAEREVYFGKIIPRHRRCH